MRIVVFYVYLLLLLSLWVQIVISSFFILSSFYFMADLLRKWSISVDGSLFFICSLSWELYIHKAVLFTVDSEKRKKEKEKRKNIIIILFVLIYFCHKITNSMAYGTGKSMLHLQGITNNPYPELNQPNSSYRLLFFQDAF